MECLISCLLHFGHGLVVFVIEQWRNSASFAQDTLSCPGESCRSPFSVQSRAFRSDDQGGVWTKHNLA